MPVHRGECAYVIMYLDRGTSKRITKVMYLEKQGSSKLGLLWGVWDFALLLVFLACSMFFLGFNSILGLVPYQKLMVGNATYKAVQSSPTGLVFRIELGPRP